MKTIVIYTQGGIQSAVFRYRFFQYFNKIDCCCKYRKALPDMVYEKIMPIGEKNIFVKVYAFMVMMIRVSFQLLHDTISKPDCLIISRILGKRYLPIYFCWLLKLLKKRQTKIVWDFDDDILEMKELSRDAFDFLSLISDKIVIASPYLKALIREPFLDKIVYLPTTDGMLLSEICKKDKEEKISKYDKEINLLWIGTSSSLHFVSKILPHIEKAGKILRSKGKSLNFLFVCNRTLNYDSRFFYLQNIKWSQENATMAFKKAHIGLMPLDNSRLSRGKGGFKLIQYMSVSVPTIASSVGINRALLKGGGGYLIDNLDSLDWCTAIVRLSSSIELWNSFSQKAFRSYNTGCSFLENLKKWKTIVGVPD